MKEYFLNTSLKNIEKEAVEEEIKEALIKKKFNCIHGKHCMYCASKDVCLEFGTYSGGE